MFEQGQPGIVEPDVGRCLCAESCGEGDAGQSRRQEDNADWCRHRGET
jgi:hypothetical protein